MRLFRPLGLKELELIISTGNQSFPPRLDWQPIFYPVLNYEYAAQIAQRWNTVDEFSGYVGFITEFEVEDSFIEKYEVKNVGGKIHNEYWIPAEELAAMNEAIVGEIQITGSYYGPKYQGVVSETSLFAGQNAVEQAEIIAKNPDGIIQSIKTEKAIMLANLSFWELRSLTLAIVKDSWKESFPTLSLQRSESIINK